MYRRMWNPVLVVLVVLFGVAAMAQAQGLSTRAETHIVVTHTGDDYTDGKTKKCSDVPADQCTLRRAINQAYSAATRPVYIDFNIPTGDPGYNATLKAWKITLTGSVTYDLRELNGNTILDGTTQPGGRANGPKIIVDGQGDKNNGFILRQGGNEVRGLAMQDFKNTHITISSDDNIIEDCWFGLSDDGQTLSSGSDTEPEGGSGVGLSAGSDRNHIQGNVFAGFFEVAAAIRGNQNIFVGNRIGTRANGTVPLPAQFDQHPCLSGTWTGGSGITVADRDNQIGGPTAADGNLFAGLFLNVGSSTTQRPAMDVGGRDHLIQNNIIGLDANSGVVGVCGRGMDFGNSPSDMEVLANTIVQPGLSAILMNGTTLNGNTLQGNVIIREGAWPEEQGLNDFPEDAIAFGRTAPQALRSFVPAKITEVDGTTVRGTSGDGSPCPGCTVEVFLDDKDPVTEALQSVDLVVANGVGNWQATLPAPLGDDQALRTMSTVPDDFTITGLDEGTTSNLSALQSAAFKVFLPLVAR
jgi:hypothetical protein